MNTVSEYLYEYVCLCCSGATKGCVWRMGLVRRAWMEAGVCGHPGRSVAGPVEEECPLLSDTVTAPGMGKIHYSTQWISL